MPSDPTIFVQIASFRDPECQWTVKDLFEKAAKPDRIYVGICWQFDKEADQNCFEVPAPLPNQVRITECDAKDSLGVGWARAQAQSLYRNEDYILMIDSHMRFEPDWDEAMLDMLRQCSSEKAVISNYPPGYELPNTPKPNAKSCVMCSKFFLDEGGIRLRGENFTTPPPHPLRGAFIAGGYMFSSGKVVSEVPYDPYMYNGQEEMSIAMRLFTHGWDVYAPHRVVMYHLYNNDAPPQKKLHWEDRKDWTHIRDRAQRRFDYMCEHIKTLPPEDMKDIAQYGLGSVRTLDEYQEFCGIDFRNKFVTNRSLKAEFVSDLAKYRKTITVKEVDGKPASQWPKGYKPTLSSPAPITSPAKQMIGNATQAGIMQVGDFIPPFCLKDDQDVIREFQLFAGKLTVLSFIPSDYEVYNQEFFAAYAKRRTEIEALPVKWYFVSRVTVEKAAKFRKEFSMPRGVLADSDGALARVFGMDEAVSKRPLTVLLDKNQKIAGFITQNNATNHMGDMLRALKSLTNALPKPTLYTQPHAPVHIVPDVLDEALANRILQHFETGKQYKGKIGDEVVKSGKRRTDVDVADADLLRAIDTKLAQSLFPEIQKIGAFEVTHRQRYRIGCYDSADEGFYNQHRDTGLPSNAYRRYSVSIMLNDAFEGGEVEFPEYHAQYKAPKYGALCFPSALLHQINPVTSGKRYVMVSFLHGEEEEAFRKSYMEAKGESYKPEQLLAKPEKHFKQLQLSEFYYTRKELYRGNA